MQKESITSKIEINATFGVALSYKFNTYKQKGTRYNKVYTNGCIFFIYSKDEKSRKENWLKLCMFVERKLKDSISFVDCHKLEGQKEH